MPSFLSSYLNSFVSETVPSVRDTLDVHRTAVVGFLTFRTLQFLRYSFYLLNCCYLSRLCGNALVSNSVSAFCPVSTGMGGRLLAQYILSSCQLSLAIPVGMGTSNFLEANGRHHAMHWHSLINVIFLPRDAL